MSSAAADLDRMVLEAQPIIARVVSSRLRTRVYFSHAMFRSSDDDAIEACAQAQARLFLKFERVLSGEDPDPVIRSFADYVATAAHGSVNEVLHARAPQRRRFANRIRRVLRQEARFATWVSGGVTLVGLSAWKEQDRAVVSAETLDDRSDGLRRDRLLGTSWGKSKDADWELATTLVDRVLQLADGPVERHALIGFLTDLVGVPTRMLVIDEGGDSGDDEHTEETVTPASSAARAPEALAIALEETTNELRRFWLCCAGLEQAGKVAILLNVPAVVEEPAKPSAEKKRAKKSGGRAEIAVLAIRGVASIAEIGRQLELTSAQVARLGAALGIDIPLDDAEAPPIYHIWNHLPVRDKVIAATLGRPANQIPNIRDRALKQVQRCRKQSLAASHIPVRQPSAGAGD